MHPGRVDDDEVGDRIVVLRGLPRDEDVAALVAVLVLQRAVDETDPVRRAPGPWRTVGAVVGAPW